MLTIIPEKAIQGGKNGRAQRNVKQGGFPPVHMGMIWCYTVDISVFVG